VEEMRGLKKTDGWRKIKAKEMYIGMLKIAKK